MPRPITASALLRHSRRWVLPLSALALLAVSCGGSADATASAEPNTVTESTTGPEPTEAAVLTEATEPEPAPVPTPLAEATAEPAPVPTPLAEATAEPQTSIGDFSAVADEIKQFVLDRGINGASLIVVDRDEGVLYEDYFGEFGPDRVSLIASSSKMISAGVLLKLQEQGLIDVNAPVTDYVQWGDAESAITGAQLISNSSGLVGLGPNPLYAPYICQWLPADELEDCGERVFTSSSDDDDVIPPDTEFRYGGAQWQVAGALAEVVSGKPWAQLIEEIYVGPCELDSLGYVSLGSVLSANGGPGYPAAFGGSDFESIDPTDNPNIEGGAYITAADYGQLLLMHLRGGVCGENQVLTQESLDTMHADRIGQTYGGSAGSATGYGMGWWIDRDTDRISDGGAFGSVPWLDLDDGYGAFLLVEDTTQTGGQLAALIEDLVHEAVVG